MVFINVLGLLAIVLIVWWFWLYRPASVSAQSGSIEVIVENGIYEPAVIRVPANSPVTLKFIRKDASPCAEWVQFPALEISEALPLNASKAVELPGLSAGEYPFHCQMQMYRGRLLVE